MSKSGRLFLANSKCREETGFEYIRSGLKICGIYGEKALKEARGFMPGEENELEALFDDMDILWAFAADCPDAVGEVQRCLMECREISLTIKRCGEEVLFVPELFDLKAFLLRSGRIRELLSEIRDLPARYTLRDTTELLDSLDPEKQRTDAFYIYDFFSRRLADLRNEKKEQEFELRRCRKEAAKILERQYGFHMSPRFELTVPRGDDGLIALANGCPRLQKTGEDYMNITFTLVPGRTERELYAECEKLKLAIEEEERAVCRGLSDLAASFREDLTRNCAVLGALDMDLAKVIYAQEHGCIRPEILREQRIYIEEGRNIQAEDSLKEKGRHYFPVSIELNRGVTVLSGANMGGKTITLKMAGQIVLLAQNAMYVPAKRVSVGLSSLVCVLIGDSQNLQRGLSTFGGEMDELREILDKVRDRALFIIDEIASGTNPTEGQALTKAFIRYFSRQPVITFITTHFDCSEEGGSVKKLQVRGLCNADFERLSRELDGASRRHRIEILGKYMDYSLEESKNAENRTGDAVRIASVLGIYREITEDAERIMKGETDGRQA